MGIEYYGGPRTLNGLTVETQTFQVGGAGTDFGIISSVGTHTFNIPDASASARGLVTTGTQTIAGAKTFSTSLSSPSLALTTDSSSSPGLNFTYVTNGGVIANNGTRSILFNAGGITMSQNTFIDSAIKLQVNGFMTGSSNILDIRNSTGAQTLRVFNTYTSSTSYETLNLKGKASANFEIGPEKGSGGGTIRGLTIGGYESEIHAIQPWLTFTNTGEATFSGAISSSNFTGISTGTNTGDQDAVSNAQLATAIEWFITGEDLDQELLSYLTISAFDGAAPFHTTGTDGSDFNIVHIFGGYSSQFNIPDASAIARGLITTGAQTIAGAKTLTGNTLLTQTISTGGSPTALTLTGAAHSALTLSTEATDVNFNLARSVQFATGALTTQRAMRIQAPTYTFLGASTITTASTLSISGPPVAGSHATITNPYALNVESGIANFGGNLHVTGDNGILNGTSNYMIMPYASFNGVGGGGMWQSRDGCLITFDFANQSGSRAFKLGRGTQILTDALSNIHITATRMRLSGCAAASHTIDIENSTNAQSLGVYGTWTSTTSYERVNIRGKAAANFEIGPENGSAGGTLRGLTIGGYSAGTTTIAPWLTFTNAGAATFAGPIASTKGIYFTSEPTGTPSGTTQTLTLADGNHQTLALTSATGTVTATLTVPTGSSSGTIIVKQHASAAKDITWAVSAGTIKWMGAEPDWVADAINAVRIVSWRYNGSVMYLASTEVAV